MYVYVYVYDNSQSLNPPAGGQPSGDAPEPVRDLLLEEHLAHKKHPLYRGTSLKRNTPSQDEAPTQVDNPAGTHLNLCATLSQLGRHQPALEHAQCALELLKQ